MNNKIKVKIVNPNKLFMCGIKAMLEKSNNIELENCFDFNPNNIINEDSVYIFEQSASLINNIKKINKLHNKTFKTIVFFNDFDKSTIKEYLENKVKGLISANYNDENLEDIISLINHGGLILDNNICNVLEEKDYASFDNKKFSRSEFRENHGNLTQREYEVLKLIVAGKSNLDIANELTISEHTAKAHVCNVIQKLVVDDRTQAAVKALKEGLVPLYEG